MSRTPLVQLEEVSFSYGRQNEAIRSLDLALNDGVVGLLGANGAGKSTLLSLLAAVRRPTSGRIEFLLSRVGRPSVGLMPQQIPLPGGVRLNDFVHYMAWMKGVPRRERPSEAERVIALADLENKANDRLGHLSGGMQRRVLLAQALLGEPELLLLDEPFVALDPEQRVGIRTRIAEASKGRCTVISSHTIEDLVHLADRILMLDEGRLVFDGSLDDLLQIGSDQANSPRDITTAYEAAFLRLRRGEVGESR